MVWFCHESSRKEIKDAKEAKEMESLINMLWKGLTGEWVAYRSEFGTQVLMKSKSMFRGKKWRPRSEQNFWIAWGANVSDDKAQGAKKERLRRIKWRAQRNQGSKRSRLDIIEDNGKNEDRNLSIRGLDIRGIEECLGFLEMGSTEWREGE